MSKLLFEIGTEELPAGYIDQALQQIEQRFCAEMQELQISHGQVTTLATPRRLTLIVDGLAAKQDDVREEILGPSVQAGCDADGNYTKAAEGFAKSKGAAPEDLQIVDTAKGKYLMLVRERQGQPVEEVLPEVLHKLVVTVSFPKTMRWGSKTISFARPIQWLVALNGSSVIGFELEGLVASNRSRGHRFLHNYDIEITSSDDYEEQLTKVDVIVDPEKRRQAVLATITKAVEESGFEEKAKVFVDDELLDIVTNLVESPFGICGRFDEKFLQLPDEVLITSMKEHQKYFPVVNEKGKLLAGFVAVNNTRTKDDNLTRQGHERVLRARLEDALFFFNSDQSRKLDDFIPGLEGAIFQAKLGTMLAKNERINKLTRLLAEKLEPAAVEDACRAASLCKADLLTDMVGEFPSLQGTMGQAYALIGGEKENVALAVKEHYMPKRAGAELPSQAPGAMVGLADRIDTLAGCFGIGQVPSGTADPFGLRRIALAIIHIVEKNGYHFSFREVVHKALALYGDKVDGSSATVDAILNFVEGRYRNDCLAREYDAGAVAAAVGAGFEDIYDCGLRVEALAKMKSNPEFAILAGSYKRIKNIIKDNKTTTIEENLLVEEAEKQVHQMLVQVREQMQPMLVERNYLAALESFLRMKEVVDVFFDKVMVMDENEAVRRNRLNLLTAIGELVLQVGDISKMQES